jgi:hypothetical protein
MLLPQDAMVEMIHVVKECGKLKMKHAKHVDLHVLVEVIAN